jgi:predicted O-methyltransferase YrrM
MGGKNAAKKRMGARATTGLNHYLHTTFVAQPQAFAAVITEAESRVPGMQISPYEGHMLSWLVRISGATRILEIGTFMGYSALCMARALPVSGHVTTLEARQDHAQAAVAHIAREGFTENISVHHTDGCAWLKAQPAVPQFDFLFIDGMKKEYASYYALAKPLLLPGAWVVVDNSLLFGALEGAPRENISEEAIAAVSALNAQLAAEADALLIPTLEGMTVARLRQR